MLKISKLYTDRDLPVARSFVADKTVNFVHLKDFWHARIAPKISISVPQVRSKDRNHLIDSGCTLHWRLIHYKQSRMEVVPIEKQIFEAMIARFLACTEQMDALLRANDEQRMNQWLDN